jgi:hypothetical protein
MIEDIIPFVVSTEMDDYLKLTIPRNRYLFKNFVLVTKPTDEKTIDLCNKHFIDIVYFNDFYKNASFNKSGAIHAAQKILHEKYKHKWLLLHDSDIIFPEDLKEKINNVHPRNKEALYGIDRYNVMNMEDLQNEVKNNPYVYAGEYSCFIGSFQLYYNKNFFYPIFSRTAGTCDVQFLQNFKIKQKIPNSHVFHIGKRGMHWNGRRKQNFWV